MGENGPHVRTADQPTLHIVRPSMIRALKRPCVACIGTADAHATVPTGVHQDPYIRRGRARVVGAPAQLVDGFLEWVRVGVDGFNIAYAITPGTFADFVEGVVPVLQQRGLMQADYQEGTLREKLFGRGQARLLDRHPAAQYRRTVPRRAPTAHKSEGESSIRAE